MLVLNEALARVRKSVNIRFLQVRYSLSEIVFIFLIEKANAKLLIPRLFNVLIQIAMTVDTAIIGVKILEQGQRLKVYGMSLD